MIDMYFNNVLLTAILTLISYYYYTVLQLSEIKDNFDFNKNPFIPINCFKNYYYTNNNNQFIKKYIKFKNNSIIDDIKTYNFDDLITSINDNINTGNKIYFYSIIEEYIKIIDNNINNIIINNNNYTYSFFDILDNNCIKFGFSGTTSNIDMTKYILLNNDNEYEYELIKTTNVENIFNNIQKSNKIIKKNYIKSFIFPINNKNINSNNIELLKYYYLIDLNQINFIDVFCELLIKYKFKSFIDVGAFLKYISIDKFIDTYINNYNKKNDV